MDRRLIRVIIPTILFLLILTLAVPVVVLAVSGEAVGSWEKQAGGGFGVGGDNLMAYPFCAYRGELFVGVLNDGGAEVRRLRGGVWEAVCSPGFGDGDNLAVTSMRAFGDNLYAGTLSLDGCQVWRYDGSVWTQVAGQDADGTPGTGPGFGDAGNLGAMSMEVHQSKLYVGTLNLGYSLIPLGVSSDGAEIWTYDGSAWNRVVDDGFGDTLNAGVMTLQEYGGELYAGTMRVSITQREPASLKIDIEGKGCELRRKGASGWPRIGERGFGRMGNGAVMAMEIYAGKLFMSTMNGSIYIALYLDFATMDIVFEDFSWQSDGCCVYSYDGSTITEEVAGGFGDSANLMALSMASLSLPENDVLLVGVAKLEGEGIDDLSMSGSLHVYNGKDWYRGAEDGFGNPDNWMISSLWPWDGEAFAGTLNPEGGCEIWHGAPPPFPTPFMDSIAPPRGWAGSAVVINGEYFGASKGRSRVLFAGGIEAVTTSWSDTSIACVVPEGMRSGEVVVETAAGTSNGVWFEIVELATNWYLAEGCTAGGFETWVLVQNPNDAPAEVTLTFMTDSGLVPGPTQILEPNSRFSWNVSSYAVSYNVSTQVEAELPVVAERAMYWGDRTGGHDSIGYHP